MKTLIYCCVALASWHHLNTTDSNPCAISRDIGIDKNKAPAAAGNLTGNLDISKAICEDWIAGPDACIAIV
jgi:hypothetical protein